MNILQPEENPRFGLGFRILVVSMALLGSIALTLNASQQGEFRAWIPAFFCYAIIGAVLLPKRAAMICGYFIASIIFLISAWFLIEAIITGVEIENARRFFVVYGTPSLGFLIYGKVRSYKWNLTIKSIKDALKRAHY